MENWNKFLEELEKRGWKKISEDDHFLIFEHKAFGKVIFNDRVTQEEMLEALEEMENVKSE